ncbi:MAG: RNA methyltransferase [Planctomycetaceae bacterium]|nr:RNA methyltransferase [Planctomycetaceae bacterium]
MEPVTITDLNDSRLDVFRSLRTTNANRRSNVFIAEGTTLVERVLHSDYEVECVLASEQKLRNFRSRIPAGTTVYQMPRALASQLVGYSFHNGVMVAARRRESPLLADVVPACGASLVLVGDQIIDEQNLGLLVRIGSAFGASAVVAGAGSADAFSRRVLRVSMGNGLVTPVIMAEDTGACLQQLRTAGHTVYGAVLDDQATELADCDFAARSVIVVGNETHGICDAVRQQCDGLITISMHNNTDSLNVAIASGIFVHAYRSQHAVVPPSSD